MSTNKVYIIFYNQMYLKFDVVSSCFGLSGRHGLFFASFEDRLFETHHWGFKHKRHDESNTICHAHVTEEKIDLKQIVS